MTVQRVAALLGVLVLSGCALLTRPMEHPVIEDSMREHYFGKAELGVLSLTPERRVAIHRYGSDIFCAENPTETGIELASAAKLLASATLPADKRVEIGAAIATASANQMLNPRSQGMQYYMATAYNLCQMVLNKRLDQSQYREDHQRLSDTAARLIALEIIYGSVKKDPAVKPPSSAASALAQSKAEIDKVLPEKPASTAAPKDGK